MTTTVGELERRRLGIALANRDAANALCEEIEAAVGASVGIDEFYLFPIPDLEAEESADIELPVFDFPIAIQSIKLISLGAFDGVDASNTIVVTVTDGLENTIVAKTYDNVTVPVDDGANALGTLHSTYKLLAADQGPRITIACGETADPPAMNLQIRYRRR